MKSFLKNTDLKEGMLNEIFNLDSFILDVNLGLSFEQIKEIITDTIGVRSLNTTDIEVKIITTFYENAGGTEKTPAVEVMSFMYIVLTNDAFNLQPVVRAVINACHVHRLFSIAVERKIIVPIPLNITEIFNIEPEIFQWILKDTKINTTVSANPTEFFNFINDLLHNDKELSSLLNNLDIKLN